ncbi:glycoside hydrolase domain-containing protein [Streptomyces sp900116325]|uniref:glycoside hydrolase domain-containing protein n=1 Tax=Streptomyces sp. 900116325 TaxID=3154295 RepID=UPI0033EADD6E
MVPQDVQGLAEAMGGRDRAARRLDVFFDKRGRVLVGEGRRRAALHRPTGPASKPLGFTSHLGRPWKTQVTVRRILDTVYGTGPGGLPGNDDLGTMSAWYVVSASGLYPRTPGGATMPLGTRSSRTR